MSKPFRAEDDFVVIYEGKWYRFPTPEEAWDFYKEKLKEMELIVC